MSDDTPTTTPPDDLTDVLRRIDEMCHTTIPNLAVLLSPDVDAMVTTLQLLRIAGAQLRWATEELEDEIVKIMPGKQVEVVGVGMAELKTGAARKGWNNEAITDVLVARIGDDPAVFCDSETGEFLPPQRVAGMVINAFLEVARPSWRVTALRGYRIDPDEYCTTTWGRKTIVTPKVEPWAAQS